MFKEKCRFGSLVATVTLILGAPRADAQPALDGYIFRTGGGSVNGYAIDATHYEVTVAPGEAITGSIAVEVTNLWPSNVVAPLGGTVTWGDRATQPWLTNGWIPPGTHTFNVAVNKTAPGTPGNYHIVVAFRGEYTIQQVMSLTNWTMPGNPIWYDGNDAGFDWTPEQFQQAYHHGAVLTTVVTPPAQGGPYAAWLPATAVIVHVRAPSQGFCWEKRSTPLPEGYPGILVHDSKLWTFGGEIVAPTNPWNAVWSDAIRSYDPASDTWTRKGASLPYACLPGTNELTTLSDKMYMSPQIGPNLNNGWGTHNRVIEYDFVNDVASETATYCEYATIWTSTMQRSLSGHVYSFGGWNGGSVQSIYRYDGPGCLTLLLATLPDDRRLVASCRDAAGRFVMFGNYGAPSRVDIFDPATESFVFSGDIMPHDLEWASVSWLDRDGSLYIGKGWPDGVPSPTVYRFDPDAHTFTRAPFDLPVESPGAGIYRSAYDPSSGRLYLIESLWNGSNYETSLWIGTPGGCAQPDCDGNGVPDEQKLTASDAGAGDHFGTAVSISGDTAVVTAYFDDCEAGDHCGSAYVYVLSGGVWILQQKLTPSDAAADDTFGYSVAIEGDTIVVGAAGDGSGSAYVFVRSGGVWSQQQELTASDAGVYGEFGGAVSVSGDTVVVGAHRNSTLSGAAYVFVRSGGVWSEQQKLTASDASPLDRFGGSVSVSGDTAFVGAAADDRPAGFDSGSVYVFQRSGGAWTERQKLTASDAAVDCVFGFSVSLNVDTAIVAALYDDCPAGSDCGSAYVFVRSGGLWTEQQKLTAFDAQANHQFGASVSLSGDTAVVGAMLDDGPGGNDCGAAYVFRRSGGVWNQQRKLTASDRAAGDWFGHSVSVSGDTAVIDAPHDACAAGSICGSAYAFTSVLGCTYSDCNDNGIPDSQDIANCDGPAWCDDCNHNGIPDECELDSDGDARIDACDDCPNDALKTAPGICGCGAADAIEFVGFLPPIGGADATGGSFTDPLRAFKLSSTIPVKFTATQCGSPLLTGIHTLRAVKYSSSVDSDPPIDATPTDAATSGNQFRLTDGQWHFNLSTRTGFSQGTWKLIATLSDGSTHAVRITIKK
ncbi:MAG: PxKF domain-containing protein [Planctomycetota bacterium]